MSLPLSLQTLLTFVVAECIPLHPLPSPPPHTQWRGTTHSLLYYILRTLACPPYWLQNTLVGWGTQTEAKTGNTSHHFLVSWSTSGSPYTVRRSWWQSWAATAALGGATAASCPHSTGAAFRVDAGRPTALRRKRCYSILQVIMISRTVVPLICFFKNCFLEFLYNFLSL
jgi:hypothetical protein